MKTTLTSIALAAFVMSLKAADSTPAEQVTAAAKALGGEANYSWKETVVVPESAQFKPGPTEGKLVKGGITYFTMSFGDNSTKIFLEGDKSAMNGPDGDWQSAKDMEQSEGPGRFMSRMIREFKAPAAQAESLVSSAKELKADGDAIGGEMTEDGVKSQFRFGNMTNPKGSVKFWVKDGKLAKYEFKVTGKADFNGNEFDVDRDTTVEITDVGTTKIEVPADARKKLDSQSAAATTSTNAPAAK